MLLRPHSVDVSLEASAGHAFSVSGQVAGMSYTGDSVGYRVTTAIGEILAEITPSSARLPIIGDSVSVSWNMEDAYLLPDPRGML